MSVYPESVARFCLSPEHVSKTKDQAAVGTDVNFACGCFVRIFLEIDEDEQVVRTAGFSSNGCGYMIAAAEVFASILEGKYLSDLHGLERTGFEEAVEMQTGKIEKARTPCLEAVYNATRSAFADHRSRVLDEFQGEKALVCTCFGVAEETIETFIAENSPRTADEVTENCRAGGGCGSCRMLIQEMIDAAMSEG